MPLGTMTSTDAETSAASTLTHAPFLLTHLAQAVPGGLDFVLWLRTALKNPRRKDFSTRDVARDAHIPAGDLARKPDNLARAQQEN